ncbi:ABC transporter substrate-binding protein [Roseateles amylovorans]|uniref:ABC transporter substrate-binding protein n=1 Tax=Roseateles amylovorans TaxID=2978473 RepID=A0ABY6AYG6_9BURK|nr:ABC transporter substrate-binding protein [Roseateles amylovorans]UXH78221.1 ABC transporter substrate-binding protein [Roseateles amylovorans]
MRLPTFVSTIGTLALALLTATPGGARAAGAGEAPAASVPVAQAAVAPGATTSTTAAVSSPPATPSSIAPASGTVPAAQPEKVLRYAFLVAETGFDPAQLSDLYSRIITAHIFESLYNYDYLARPFKLLPNTAAAMPEVSDDFRTWTIRLRPGIRFADDPAFGGRVRELTAEDYVYSLKRFFDPAVKSPLYSSFRQEGIIGLQALRDEALKTKKPFNYDKPIDGLRALDRYTLQFRLEQARPRFIYNLAGGDTYGAVAREVVERYGDRIMEHPVGTGPFKLERWRRSSLIRLVRNPDFREIRYDAQPNPDDVEGQALLARYKGRRLPMVDAVEISIIGESQPRWLSFLNREFDLIFTLPEEYADVAMPHGKLAPNLAKQGMHLHRVLASDRTMYYFNMEDPVVGGYTPEKVALRRAIGLATDIEAEIAQVRHHQAVPAQTVVAPMTWGYDEDLKTENSDFDLARAKALLDLYGYVDKDGDGWRDLPDGRPLVIEYASQPDSRSKPYDEMWKRDMDRLGVKLKIRMGQWPENLKAARAAQLQIWQLGFNSSTPDAQLGLELMYGPAAGGQNLGRFKLERFDELYRRMLVMPDSPERLALLREAQKLLTAYMPQKFRVHRYVTDISQPWLSGYRRPYFNQMFWQFVDIDTDQLPRR